MEYTEALQPGMLRPVPRFRYLASVIPEPAGRGIYARVHEVVSRLGRSMQLGQQRRLIDGLSSTLGFDTLVDVVTASLRDGEICAAFSVYFTTLEQAYHWPRDASVSTPRALHDHKLVIQVLHQPELRETLHEFMSSGRTERNSTFRPEEISQSALRLAKGMIEEADNARLNGEALQQERQDRVNLLYRTSRGDWFDQGSYRDSDSHKEFGGLHETMRTNGTQRAVQEIFEQAGGVSWLQKMPGMLKNLPTASDVLCAAFLDLQVAIALAREELFSMMIDEVIWGRTFAKFSKAVGFCTVSAGGADCPMFRMLDALCGKADQASQAALLDELDFRSRFFPPNIRALINGVAAAPSIRAHVSSGRAGYDLSQAFYGLQQLLYSIYEMHRKKSMRMVLSMRAGQASSSSGTEKASTPEQHLARTLGAAIRVRFGDDPESLKIDAHAWSNPLTFGADGQVQAALVRLIFSTPMVVSPGDTVSVTVQVRPGERHTRTYSITQTYAHAKSSPDRTCRAVGSVEICARSSGLVSSFLCQQQVGFPVMVAIQSASHFRIAGNSGPGEKTVFVAQGGAIGIFISWLSRQERLQGGYLLVVGARDYAMLPYANQLEMLAGALGPQLQVVVALSQTRQGDVQRLLKRNIKAYSGRVTGYLALCSLGNTKASYVCGSAAFGLNVARCLNAQLSVREDAVDNPRVQSIVTSRIPDMRLHVAAGSGSKQVSDPAGRRSISRAELALHNSPGDMWIALGDRVFDISTVPSFHPGGEKVLINRAGSRADLVFDSVHKNSFEVDSLLDQMAIGHLASSPDEFRRWEDILDSIVEIQNDLMNHTRFEQAPTGSRTQLVEAPPADIIRGSLECFVKSWTTLLGEAVSTAACQQLWSSLEKARASSDEYQARVYAEYFDDETRCATSLRDIFDAHISTAVNIHTVIDGLKRHIFTRASKNSTPEARVLEDATVEIAHVIEDALVEDALVVGKAETV